MIVFTAVTLLATFDVVFASSCLMYNINDSPNTLRYMRHEPLTAPVTHGCILACQALDNCTAVAVWNQTSGEGRNCSLLIVESGESVEYGDGSGVGADPNAELMTKPGGPVAPPPPCPTGFTLLEGTCFHVSADSTYDFNAAETYCIGLNSNKNSRLATIDTLAKGTAAAGLTGAGNGYIGAKWDAPPASGVAPTYSFLHPPKNNVPTEMWLGGQPGAGGSECVFMLTSGNFFYTGCLTTNKAYCEVDVTV